MRAILILGWKSYDTAAEPEVLYCGLDGVAAMKRAGEARESGVYKRLGKLVNPSCVPLAAVPVQQSRPVPAAEPPKSESPVASIEHTAPAAEAPAPSPAKSRKR